MESKEKKCFSSTRYCRYLLLESSEVGMVLYHQIPGIFKMLPMICSCNQVASDSKTGEDETSGWFVHFCGNIKRGQRLEWSVA